MANKLSEITQKYGSYLYKWYMIGGLFFVCSTYLTLTIPSLIEKLVDRYVEYPEGTKEYASLALLICIIGCGIMVIRTLSRVCVFWAGRLIESLLRQEYFSKSLDFARDSLEKIPVGDMISRMSTDMREVGFLYGLGITLILNFVLIFSFVLYKMLAIHSELTMYVLFPSAIHAVIMVYIAPKFFQYSRMQQKKVAHLSSNIAESFHNVQALQTSGAVSSFLQIISKSNEEVFRANVKFLLFRDTIFLLLSRLSILSYVVVFFYGGKLALDGDITLGNIAAFNAYITLLALPLRSLGFFVAIRERSKAACVRLEELDALPLERAHPPKATSHALAKKPSIASKHVISLKNVHFAYPSTNTPVLKHLCLDVRTGEHLVIAGRIGSGKSTICKILTGFYATPRETYTLAGVDACDLSPQEIRKQVGWVTQEAHFFSGSIRHNLLMNQNHQDAQIIERMQQVCKDVCLYDEIISFPKGFDSQIGEDGIRLSGGQKQRLSLARALLRERLVYVLDDVFSALDHNTEEKIIHMLRKLSTTFIIISHRPSIMQFCDRVALLANGAIADIGTYKDIQDSPLLASYSSTFSTSFNSAFAKTLDNR